MTLSSDEIEILEYLKSWKGNYVSMVEVCRCAGGRKKYRESPHWAKGLMARLVESNLINVNERGHYRAVVEESVKSRQQPPEQQPPAPQKNATIVGDNYFPGTSNSTGPEPELDRWVSPQIAAILKKSGKKFTAAKAHK